MLKVIIAGGRDFTDTQYAADSLVKLVEENMLPDTFTVISGNANGADKVGEYLAKLWDLPLEIYPADWNQHGKSAGYIRNNQMANIADALVAFWDEKSKGTAHMINTMKQQHKSVFVFYY